MYSNHIVGRITFLVGNKLEAMKDLVHLICGSTSALDGSISVISICLNIFILMFYPVLEYSDERSNLEIL